MTKLCVIAGDGIGLEVIPAAVTVLQAVLPELEVIEANAGWKTFCTTGQSVPQATLEMITHCGAALFGAVASPSRPVAGYRSAILTLRQALDLYANIRPVRSLPHVSPRADVDLLLVRENSEGLYAGRERVHGDTAVAERVVTRRASRRIARRCATIMQQLGRRRLTIVHKANILPLSDGLFRDEVRDVFATLAPGIAIDERLVDAAALQLVEQPQQFDTIVTTNLYGDILSDVSAYWVGGLGLAASINMGEEVALAEPVHGSAPDIAGQGLANPIAAVLSGALLARFVWQREDVAHRLETAVAQITPKLATQEMGTRTVTDSLLNLL